MLVDLGQHVLQAMAKFVEQRGDIVMRQQSRLLDAVQFDAIGEIAYQVRYRRLQLAGIGA